MPTTKPSVVPDGKQVRKLRLEKGWNQQKLADNAKIDGVPTPLAVRTVVTIEAGGRVAPSSLVAVAEGLDADWHELLAEGGNDDPGTVPKSGFVYPSFHDAIFLIDSLIRNVPGKPKNTGRRIHVIGLGGQFTWHLVRRHLIDSEGVLDKRVRNLNYTIFMIAEGTTRTRGSSEMGSCGKYIRLQDRGIQ